jgi:phage gp46-like protein
MSDDDDGHKGLRGASLMLYHIAIMDFTPFEGARSWLGSQMKAHQLGGERRLWILRFKLIQAPRTGHLDRETESIIK